MLLVTCLVLGAGGGVGSAAEPHAKAIAWHTCEGGFQCGTLTVPLDPAAPTGPTIDLAVIRERARDPRHRIGSLVFNPGGPGAPRACPSSPGSRRACRPRCAGPVRSRQLRPAGVGHSSPIRCEDSLDGLFDQSFQPATSAARTGLVDGMTALAQACEARSGNLLAHVSTADTVQDLERLRVALGEDRLSFVGYSYGTFLGASYADAYPEHVRAFVLDGPVDPTLSATQVTLGQARGFERATRRLPRRLLEPPGMLVPPTTVRPPRRTTRCAPGPLTPRWPPTIPTGGA